MRAPPTLHRTTVRVALVVLAVAALTVAELTSDGFRDFTGGHALVSTFITEGVLLVGVYLVIDEIIGRREARRWSDVTSLGIRALSAPAHKPAEICPRGRARRLSSPTALLMMLRADETRARLFAEELAAPARVGRG